MEVVPVPNPAALDQETMPEQHEGAIQDFLNSVRSGTQPATHCEDNIHTLAMVLGAIESSENGGRPVDLKNE